MRSREDPAMTTPHHFSKTIDSPVGRLTLVASDAGLAAVLWENDDPARVRAPACARSDDHPVLVAAERQLAEYFAGTRTAFELEIDVAGTEFQQQVWRALCAIPFGETRTYGQLAAALGNARASRAVGAANRRNPLSIVAPCHRVIGADGGLTGFAGGLDVKRYLLAHERRRPATP
jgi:methylated-DNA-[protein]-cysteine S-methyltransferase